MNIFAQINEAIKSLVKAEFPEVAVEKITAEPPKDAAHGDIATNAAMIVAAQTGGKPKEIAERLDPHLLKLTPLPTTSTPHPNPPPQGGRGFLCWFTLLAIQILYGAFTAVAGRTRA